MRVALGCGCGLISLLAMGAAARAQAPGQDSAPASVVSQVRIVRLSEIRETVELDRNTGKGFEQTIANMPIVAGNRLRTAKGWAEVEFEDNSSLRIAPETEIEFQTLGRTAFGATVNAIKLDRGTLYFSLQKMRGNDYAVKVGGETVTLPPASHIRLDVYPAGSELYVFQGRVTVADAAGERVVEKERSLTFDAPGQAEPVEARDRTPGRWDNWDQQAVQYHNLQANALVANGSPYGYGVADMNYYGAYSDFSGCGQMWRPYFVSAAWDPFANGLWAYYPGAGYSFVSPYPWGWTPYHSGSWDYCGGGWGWRPTGNWAGLPNHLLLRTIKGPPRGGPRPITPPAAGKATLVVVGDGKLPYSYLKTGDGRFVFTQDSAGLGVPRETFGRLEKISDEVSARGSAVQTVSISHLGEGIGESVRGSEGGLGRPAAAPGASYSRPVMTGSASQGARESGGYSSGGFGGSSTSGAHVSSAGSVSSSASVSSSSSSSGSSASSGAHH